MGEHPETIIASFGGVWREGFAAGCIAANSGSLGLTRGSVSDKYMYIF